MADLLGLVAKAGKSYLDKSISGLAHWIYFFCFLFWTIEIIDYALAGKLMATHLRVKFSPSVFTPLAGSVIPIRGDAGTQVLWGPKKVKNHWLSFRANQWSLVGETPFPSVPPCNSLVFVSDPWWAFLIWQSALQEPQPQGPLFIASSTTKRNNAADPNQWF